MADENTLKVVTDAGAALGTATAALDITITELENILRSLPSGSTAIPQMTSLLNYLRRSLRQSIEGLPVLQSVLTHHAEGARKYGEHFNHDCLQPPF